MDFNMKTKQTENIFMQDAKPARQQTQTNYNNDADLSPIWGHQRP